MTLRIHQFRVSIAQVVTALDLLNGGHHPGSPPLRQVALSTGYRQLYQRVRAGGQPDPATGVSVPWNVPPDDQPFWSHYLGQEDIRNVNEKVAWNSSVPLRKPIGTRAISPITSAELGASVTKVRESPVAYVYPHGIGLVLDIDVRGDFDAGSFADAVFRLRGASPLATTGNALRVSQFLSEQLEKEAADLELEPASQCLSSLPWTVVTLVSADTPSTEAQNNPTLRQALLALTDWRKHWRHYTVGYGDLQTSAVAILYEPPIQLVLGGTRGRVVWYPLDLPPAPKRSALGRLHSELTLSALQVESLAQLACLSLSNPNWSPMQENRVRAALAMLRALYHRARGYSSDSPRRHIVDNGMVSQLNQAQVRLWMKPSF